MTSTAELILSSSPLPHVRVLNLNRPAKRNALSEELVIQLAARCREAASDEQVRCVVLSGTEQFFSAGADIKEMQERGIEAIDNPARRAAWREITYCPKPIVAAVEGVCFGGGHELAMLSDIVIAGESAQFAQPEVNVGVIPGDGGTQRLTRVAGKSLAMLMILTGAHISARAAMDAGLVAEVVETGKAYARALDVAETIAQKPPRSVELAKAAILAAYQTPLDAGIEFERQSIRNAFMTSDQLEGMNAFFEKRRPVYKGK